jgi:hypothetical protein
MEYLIVDSTLSPVVRIAIRRFEPGNGTSWSERTQIISAIAKGMGSRKELTSSPRLL